MEGEQAVLRPGRRPLTTHDLLGELALDLFVERGFDSTTVEDIAREAGIGRRTFFRYYASKNDVVWGDFDTGLAVLRSRLAAAPPDQPVFEALVESVLAFNGLDDAAEAVHRRRMELILHVPALQAHSTLRYASWRAVVAEFVAARRLEHPQDAVPQLVAHTLLAATVAGYEQWLIRPHSSLPCLLEASLRRLGRGLGDLDR